MPLPLPEGLTLTTGMGQEKRFGRSPLSKIVSFVGGRKGYVVAAINGDFFTKRGEPVGIYIQDGRLIFLPHPHRSALVGLKGGCVVITRFRCVFILQTPDGIIIPMAGLNGRLPGEGWCLYTRPRGTVKLPRNAVGLVADADQPLRPNTPLRFRFLSLIHGSGQEVTVKKWLFVATGAAKEQALQIRQGGEGTILCFLKPLDASFNARDILWAVGGGPRLLRDGRICVEWLEEKIPISVVERRHPRTAVGLTEKGMVWVVVDGRQPNYSQGMTLWELAKFLRDMGCRDALNLDGGGSSTLILHGEVVNRPSEGRERPIINALLLLNLFPPQPLVRLHLRPLKGHFLAGTSLPLSIFAEDAVHRLFPFPLDSVTLDIHPPLLGWRWDGERLWLPPFLGVPKEAVTVRVKASGVGVKPAIVQWCLHARARKLLTDPFPLLVSPGGSVPLSLRVWGRDPEGQVVPLTVPMDAIRWRVHGGVGGVTEGTFFAVSEAPKRGKLLAGLGGVTAETPVFVGTLMTAPLHELETLEGMGVRCVPEEVFGEARIVPDPKRSGIGATVLRYDLSKGRGVRSVHLVLYLPVPPDTVLLSLWVYGDGQGCWLRGLLRDGKGKAFYLTFADAVTWKGSWRKVFAVIPERAVQPLTLESLYVVAFRPEDRPRGRLVLDGLTASILR